MIIDKIPELNHSYTPLFLTILNRHIIQCLNDEEGDNTFPELLRCIEIRHKVIIRELERLSGDERKEFAKNESEIQAHLDKMANKLLRAYKDKLLEFKRAKAALKRYE